MKHILIKSAINFLKLNGFLIISQSEIKESLLYSKKISLNDLLNPFSKREMEIARIIISGDTNIEIASKLKISTNTVNNHIENMKEKVNCRSKAELVAYLLKNGIVD